ncbi:hypothetical protein V1477_002304 [Vespula maculifrons]|uniref:Uncharacterized protein n=1 Tax=Vespula maculifrons TaxID=7453 RepID=A0ABD2CW51_VESMC
MRLVRGEARARNHRDTTTVRTWDERSGGYGVRWSATREAEVTALRSNRHPVGFPDGRCAPTTRGGGPRYSKVLWSASLNEYRVEYLDGTGRVRVASKAKAKRRNAFVGREAPIETLMNRSLRFSGVSYIGTTLGYPDDGDAEEGREGRELSGGAGGRGEEGEGVRGGGGKW